MLLPQTHSPELDYSLFIMETVEMSMEKKETSPAGLRRSSPLQSAASWSLFLVSLVWRLFLRKTSGGSLYRRFLVTRMLQGEGSTQTGPRGPKEVGPRGQVQGPHGAPSFAPPDSIRLLLSLLGLPPCKIMIPVNLQLIMTSLRP